MTKKPKLTLEQHKKLGEEIEELRTKADALFKTLKITTGVKSATQATRISNAISKIRNTLLVKATAEGLQPHEVERFYFPLSEPQK